MNCNHRNPSDENYSAKRQMKGFFYTVEGEIKELENLMSDIRAKITDFDILEKKEIRKLEEKDTNRTGIQSQTDAASSLENLDDKLKLISCMNFFSRLKGCSGEVASFYIQSFHESRTTTSSPEDDRRNGLVMSAINQLLGNTDPNNVPKETRKFIAAGIASNDVGAVMK